MRILAVIESPSWIDYQVVSSLEDMGHHVTRFVYGEAVTQFYGRSLRHVQRQKNQQLLEQARALHAAGRLDLIVCYVYDDFLLEEQAAVLSALGVPMVNINVDMVNQWYRQIRTARYFTAILCAHRQNMEQIARYGGRALYFPMAARLTASFDGVVAPDFEPAAPVTFLGTPMLYRLRVLSMLESENIPVAVYGRYWNEDRHVAAEGSFERTFSDIRHYAWPRLRAEGTKGLWEPLRARLTRSAKTEAPVLKRIRKQPPLADATVPALFRRSQINLGFTRIVGDDPDQPGQTQVKLRDFEVPLAGGFYLVEHVPEYESLFTPGVEVETWKTPRELVSKIRHYLTHDDERRKIAAAGERRARAEHTWAHRFEALFATLGLTAR